jgi:hypothetical protein
MRKVLVACVMVGIAIEGSSAFARPVVRGSAGLSVRMGAGLGTSRVAVAEPAGVIRVLRVVAPAGTRVKVTGVIPGLAGVSVAIPLARSDNSGSCARRGGAVVCNQGEEWCPMPAATWRFRVRKLAGPAGRIRIDFVVGPPAHTG